MPAKDPRVIACLMTLETQLRAERRARVAEAELHELVPMLSGDAIGEYVAESEAMHQRYETETDALIERIHRRAVRAKRRATH